MNRERHILERAVRVVAEQTAAADGVIDDAYEVGLGGSHRLTVHAKMLRLKLLNVKSALERELATLSLDCRDCGRDVHLRRWSGRGGRTLAHAEPAPHDLPAV